MSDKQQPAPKDAPAPPKPKRPAVVRHTCAKCGMAAVAPIVTGEPGAKWGQCTNAAACAKRVKKAEKAGR